MSSVELSGMFFAIWPAQAMVLDFTTNNKTLKLKAQRSEDSITLKYFHIASWQGPRIEEK